ncbi:MAG: glycosyl transferase [Spirochaetes bacterium RBG_13_51_14]|nr:MAG: glycosyl transferase [Spirochaetes bacterium RBG_13_51_14]
MPAPRSSRKKNPRAPHLSVVLPVYNEEKNILLQYEEIVKALRPLKTTCEVIFIDDGSSDASPKILRGIAKKDKNIKLILFRRNFGQTAAMAAGIDYASGEIIVFMDSDLQNDPGDIGMLVAKIEEGYDVVSGWRKKRMDRFLSRRLPSLVANWLIAKSTGVKLHDLGCSLKAYRGDLLKQVNLYGEMHRFIPVHASWIGARITEVPVAHHARKYGRSKYGIRRTFKVLLDLVTVTFLGKYSTKPIYVFGGTGVFLFILSLISGATVILMKIFLYQSMTRNPLLLLTVLLIVLSVLFIQIGILAEILIRIYHESQGKQPYSILETMNIRKR